MISEHHAAFRRRISGNRAAPEAEQCFRPEIEVARRQSAKSWELRATMSLARLLAKQNCRAAAHANLGPVLCALGQFDEGIAHLERALALDPEYTTAHGNLGEAYATQGKHALAARQFTLAVDASPDNPFLLNRLAWLLATSPEDDVRKGARAVDLAGRAVSLTSRQDLMSLETLSAAYAEAGRFEDAVNTGREALALAERQGNGAAAPQLANRILLFEARRKYRETQ